MKQSISALAGLVAVVLARDGPLPACGNTCVNNMLAIAQTNFGCTAGTSLDKCACCHIDFGYGIRDCSRQACGGDTTPEFSSVISYASNYCATAVSTCATGTFANNAYAGLAAFTVSSGSFSSTSGSVAALITSSSSVSASMGMSNSMNSSSMAMTASSSYGPSGIFAGAESRISLAPGRSDAYILADGKTVRAGSSAFATDGTTWSALGGGSGIVIQANGASTTYTPSLAVGTAGKGATVISNVSFLNGKPVSTLTSGDVGYVTSTAVATTSVAAVVSTSTVVTSSGFAPMRTAAPAFVGAAAMAILAL